MTYIEEYYKKIKSGKIVASKKVIRTYDKIVKDLKNKRGKWHYSESRGQHIIDFIERYCRHSQGKLGGKPVVLELWEKAMLSTIFGFVDKQGRRKYQKAVLIIGKKNGKSLLASAVGLYLQVADNEPGPEVYCVATKRDQAKKIWDVAKAMVLKSPALKKRINPLVGNLDGSKYNDSCFKPLASDVNSLDGLNVHGALMDEFHQWRNGKALYDIIADGITAREQPLIFMTSTAGVIREDIYDQEYDNATNIINGYDDKIFKDERAIYFVYELDDRKEWTDPKMWVKANPGLGTIKNKQSLKEKVERAKQNPALVKNLLCKEFNIRETSNQAWLSFEEIENKAKYDIKELRPRYGIGGLDLSTTTDLTCATIIFQVPGDDTIYVKQMYWLPEDNLQKRVQEDKIPYDKWIEQGWMRVSQGNKIDYKDVTAWYQEVIEEDDLYPYQIGYDSWNSQYIVDELKLIVGAEGTKPIIQGAKTMSAPMKSFQADLAAKRINYNNNPILRWNLANASINIDRNDNYTLCKTSNPRMRIDGVASLLDAYICFQNCYDEYMNTI